MVLYEKKNPVNNLTILARILTALFILLVIFIYWAFVLKCLSQGFGESLLLHREP